MAGDHRVRLSLLVSGLRWRAWSSLAMFAVAVFAAAAGAFGPVELHSADQAILDGTLAAGVPANLGLTLQPQSGRGSAAALVAAARSAPRPAGGGRWFGAPIATEQAPFTAVGAGQLYDDHLTARTGACAHLVVVAGHCPSRRGTVMLSTRSARALGLGLGDRLRAVFGRAAHRSSMVVVGLYRPGDPLAPFWWGQNYFGFGAGGPRAPLLDDAFGPPSTVAAAAPPALVTYLAQVPFRAGSLSVGQAGSMDAVLSRYERVVAGRDGVLASTELPSALAAAAASQHTTATIVGVVVVQLVLLALFVLYFVASRTAGERLPDVRLAELRGYRPRSTLAVALAEPVAVVVVAVPVGLLVAWGVAAATAAPFFGGGIGASPTLPAVLAAVGTGVVGIVATAAAGRRMLSEDTLVPGGGSGRRPPWRTVGDVLVVAVAAAAFFELVVGGVGGGGGHDDPLAAFAPGLLALAVGVLGARLLPVVLAAGYRRTAHSPRVALALATRRVGRRPEFAAPVMLLALAVGLTTFAVVGWAVDRRNQGVADRFAVGADRVLTVEVRPGVDFLSAVEASEPPGGGVMAAAVERASDGTTLAVDARRMPGVVSWPPGLSQLDAAEVAHRLVPSGLAPPVDVGGSALEVTIDARVAASPPPQLTVDLFDRGFQTPEQLVIGPLRPGTATYRASLAGLCTGGCRLVDLAFAWAPAGASATAGHVALTVATMATRTAGGRWRAVAASLGDAARWTGSPGAAIGSSGRSLTARLALDPYAPVTLAPADVPGRVPAVVTPSSGGATLGGGPSLVGLDGQTLSGRVVTDVAAVPRLGADATLVDLGTLERSLSGPFTDVTTEVWLSPSVPGDIARQLRRHGISVVGVDSVAARQAASAHGGADLAYLLFLVAAVAAAALAVGATAFGLAAGARGRGPELAAMRAVGVTAPVLRRSVRLEQLLSVGVGATLGVAAGIVASVVALRSVPELAAPAAGPPLELGLPPAALAVTVAVLAAALAVTVVLGSSAVVGASGVESLGGAT
ncbi:MAG: hypothetical protein ACYCU7_06850 [Acidimicrobiales bacterium]